MIALVLLIVLLIALVNVLPQSEVNAPEVIFYDYTTEEFETINVTRIESSTHFELYVQSNITLPNNTLNYFNLSQIENMYWILDSLYGISISNISIILCQFPVFPPVIGYYYFLLGDAVYLNIKLLLLQKFDLLRATVIHELSHLFMTQIDLFEGALIQEGFATFVETMAGYSVDYYVERYLKHPETSLTNFSGSLESYGAAYSFINFLNATYGFENIKDIAQSKAQDLNSVQQALKLDKQDLRELFTNFILATFENFTTSEIFDWLPPWSAYPSQRLFLIQGDYIMKDDWLFNFDEKLDLKEIRSFNKSVLIGLAVSSVTAIIMIVIIYQKRKGEEC